VNLGELVRRAAWQYGDRTAVVDGDREVSFRELEDRANRFAQAMLGQGLAAGDRVAVLVGNRLEWFDVTFGLAKAGLVRSYLNPRSAPPEITYQLADLDAAALVVSDDLEPLIASADPGGMGGAPPTMAAGAANLGPVKQVFRTGAGYEALLAAASPDPPPAQPDLGDLAAIAYSSGTTGQPKGVMQTHGNWLAAITGVLVEIGLDESDVLLHAGPMSHGSGGFALPALYRGSRQVIFRGFDPVELLDAVPKHGITTMFMVPTMIYMLLEVLQQHPVEVSSLRTVFYGGAPIAAARLEQCLDRFGPVFIQSYGLSEAPGGDTYLSRADHRPGNPALASAGRPALSVEMKIVGEDGSELAPGQSGEIAVRGPHVMAGYWRRPEETAEILGPDGWLRTNDMGFMDEAGYLFIVDRKADMIVSGGFNVYPREIEDVLLAHPAVAETVVVSAPDEKWGETVQAVVRLMPDTSADAAELEAFCRERLSGYKLPRAFDFVTDPLPKSPNGKVLRRLVRERYWAGRDRRVG
jgi:acyl-CoA synthetase (AMP-forming)/AMP-acid ligase II